MIEISDIITIVSIVIALGSLTTAIITVNRNSKNDVKEDTKDTIEAHSKLQSQIDITNGIITSRLEGIDNGVRDLKADNRSIRNDLNKMRDELRDEIKDTHDEAHHALELAEAAHRRLDRIGVEPDIYTTEHKGE